MLPASRRQRNRCRDADRYAGLDAISAGTGSERGEREQGDGRRMKFSPCAVKRTSGSPYFFSLPRFSFFSPATTPGLGFIVGQGVGRGRKGGRKATSTADTLRALFTASRPSPFSSSFRAMRTWN